MAHVWHKVIPPKSIKEVYTGSWMPLLDRAWESEDGYSVMSRRIKTEWGQVEHVTIQRLCGNGDIPWVVKQEIKDELFGYKSQAIEVFPSKKNLVDVCDVYHMWVLPKDFRIPFGIHPIRDPYCEPVERGYDYDLEEVRAWFDSPERKALVRETELTPEQKKRIEELGEKIHSLRKYEV